MKKFTVEHLIVLILECCALALFVLCIATDINDKLFQPLAICCMCVGSAIGIYIQWQARKNDKN